MASHNMRAHLLFFLHFHDSSMRAWLPMQGSEGKCVSCDASCAECTAAGSSGCSKCPAGRHLSSAGQGSCATECQALEECATYVGGSNVRCPAGNTLTAATLPGCQTCSPGTILVSISLVCLALPGLRFF